MQTWTPTLDSRRCSELSARIGSNASLVQGPGQQTPPTSATASSGSKASGAWLSQARTATIMVPVPPAGAARRPRRERFRRRKRQRLRDRRSEPPGSLRPSIRDHDARRPAASKRRSARAIAWRRSPGRVENRRDAREKLAVRHARPEIGSLIALCAAGPATDAIETHDRRSFRDCPVVVLANHWARRLHGDTVTAAARNVGRGRGAPEEAGEGGAWALTLRRARAALRRLWLPFAPSAGDVTICHRSRDASTSRAADRSVPIASCFWGSGVFALGAGETLADRIAARRGAGGRGEPAALVLLVPGKGGAHPRGSTTGRRGDPRATASAACCSA